jgi:hypothetical protein
VKIPLGVLRCGWFVRPCCRGSAPLLPATSSAGRRSFRQSVNTA